VRSVEAPKVAVVGLGRMGSAMARRFHDAGHQLVLWNRDRSKAEALAKDIGAGIASSPATAAKEADVVVTSLADDNALTEVYLGTDGIASGIRADAVAVDTSTVDPETVRRVGAALSAVGARFCDCPVSGSVSTVEAGALTIMAGGEPGVVAAAEPVLSAIAQKVVRVGDLGSGAACKLAVNGLLHSFNVALSEALVLAEKAGVDREAAYEVFASGAAGAPYVHYKREAFEHPEATAVAFTLDLAAKDLELARRLGDRVGATLEQTATTAAVVNEAIASGMGDRDLSAIAVYLRGES
jgi:3-hydroxyisobutyrate dehydrogenase-like beta-hydroxyacid dehydrogenase